MIMDTKAEREWIDNEAQDKVAAHEVSIEHLFTVFRYRYKEALDEIDRSRKEAQFWADDED